MTDPLPSNRMETEQETKEPSADDLKKQIQARLGQQLRATRERKEITITEASSRLRVREGYLTGLESGDWSNLPEEVYVLGFLRQYAALLGEDLQEDINALKSGKYQLTKPFTIPDPPIAPSKMWAVAAGIIFVLLFVLFNAVDGDNETPLPEAPVANTSPIPIEKMDTKQTHPKEAVKSNAISATQPHETPSDADKPATNTNNKVLSPIKETVPPPATSEKTLETHRYRLTAIEASAWLQVYDSSGTLLKEALLHPGQSLRLESSEPFLSVTCGNAAALKIEVDGTLYAEAGTLGAPEKVLHNFRIETSGHDH